MTQNDKNKHLKLNDLKQKISPKQTYNSEVPPRGDL